MVLDCLFDRVDLERIDLIVFVAVVSEQLAALVKELVDIETELRGVSPFAVLDICFLGIGRLSLALPRRFLGHRTGSHRLLAVQRGKRVVLGEAAVARGRLL